MAEGVEPGTAFLSGNGFLAHPVWTGSEILVHGGRELVAWDPAAGTFTRTGSDDTLDGHGTQPVWTGDALVIMVNQDSEGWVWRSAT